MSEKVTRRGFFARIGVLAGVAAVVSLAGKAVAAIKPTATTAAYEKHEQPLRFFPDGRVEPVPVDERLVWRDVKKLFQTDYDRSTET